jgi:hypothetical protein
LDNDDDIKLDGRFPSSFVLNNKSKGLQGWEEWIDL